MPSFDPSLSFLCGPVATMAPHLWYIILCRHCMEISGPHLCPDPWCGLPRSPSFPSLVLCQHFSGAQSYQSVWQLLQFITALRCPSSGSTELLALSSKGRLITCSLDLSSEAPVPAKMTMANAGQKIKELLLDIGDVSER